MIGMKVTEIKVFEMKMTDYSQVLEESLA